MPLVSVIVPVYNGEKYLRECLDSLFAQTLTDIEIIVVDDGSTDNSAEISHEYELRNPARFKYFYQENSGQSSARNTGLNHVSGKYIAFCDADDAYSPKALEILSAQMGSCDIAMANISYRKSPSKKWNESPRFMLLDSNTAIERTLYQHPIFNTSPCSKLFKAELFENCRFENGLFYEDLDLMPRILADCNMIAITSGSLYFYRRNPSSFINTWHTKRLDAITASERVYEFIQANYPALLPAARSRRFSAYFNIFVEACRHKNPDIASHCFSIIKNDRRAMLSDPKVRLKNKAGALASYLGETILRLIALI